MSKIYVRHVKKNSKPYSRISSSMFFSKPTRYVANFQNESDLPNEIWSHIASQVEQRSDIVNLAMTSKWMNQITKPMLLKKSYQSASISDIYDKECYSISTGFF